MDVGLSVSGIVIIIVMVLLTFVLWKVAKLLLIPIQILLFLVLMVIAYKLLFSPEKIDMISNTVTNEKIQVLVNKASDSATRLIKKATDVKNTDEPKTADQADAGTVSAGKDGPDPVNSGEKSEKTADPQKETVQVTEKSEPNQP